MHTPTPKVSVIVAAYNEELRIGRCIRSLIANTLARNSFEIIVIDDGSDDNTLQAIEPFLDDIVLIKNETNIGLPASLNKGIRASRGQFVVRVDADDFVHAEYLNILSLALRLNNSIDAVACDYLLINDRQDNVTCVNWLDQPIGCAIMYRIEHLIDIGLYDEQFFSCEDVDLRIRFSAKYLISRIPIPLYKYHIHGENMTEDVERISSYMTLVKNKHGLNER